LKGDNSDKETKQINRQTDKKIKRSLTGTIAFSEIKERLIRKLKPARSAQK